MNVLLLLTVVGGFEPSVSVTAETPAAAVERLAKIERDGPEHQLVVPARAFDGLPRPGAGVRFRASPRRSRSKKLALRIEASHDGRVVARRNFAFSWRSKLAVVVPAVNIARGAVVTAADLRLKEIETSHDVEQLALDAGQLVGRIARAALAKDHPIRLSDVTLPQIVARGDDIVVRASFGGMAVSLKATAMEAGAIGDVIRARNEHSKKVLEVEVIDHKSAEVKR